MPDTEPRKPGRPAEPVAHGTNGGYQTHRRRNEDACLKCRLAHNAAVRQWNALRKGAKL